MASGSTATMVSCSERPRKARRLNIAPFRLLRRSVTSALACRAERLSCISSVSDRQNIVEEIRDSVHLDRLHVLGVACPGLGITHRLDLLVPAERIYREEGLGQGQGHGYGHELVIGIHAQLPRHVQTGAQRDRTAGKRNVLSHGQLAGES